MNTQKQRTNGHDPPPNQRPQDSLDLQQQVIDSTSIDPMLSEENLGTGNYKSQEMWQQVDSYRNGLYASAAFKNTLAGRCKLETKNKLAINGWEVSVNDTKYRWAGWDDLSDDDRREIWEDELTNDGVEERFDRRRWIERRGEQILNQLHDLRDKESGAYPAMEALGELSGYDGDWQPAHNRMMMLRHEASRSRGARLLDNVFQRVKEQVQDVKGGRLQK